MSSKTISVALSLSLTVASISTLLGSNSAVAQGSPPPYQWQSQSGYYYGYAGPAGVRSPGFGYIFVPGRGIIDEPCGLPTSACSNAERGAD